MRGEKANDIRDLVIYTKTIPAHPADFADFPDGLHPDIRAYLASHNIPCLYTHQAELFEYLRPEGSAAPCFCRVCGG